MPGDDNHSSQLIHRLAAEEWNPNGVHWNHHEADVAEDDPQWEEEDNDWEEAESALCEDV